MRYCLSIFLLIFFAQYAYSKELSAAFVETEFYDDARNRPIKAFVWYPKRACDLQKYCLSAAARVQSPVLLSHGAMGSPLEYSWLAEALAGRGFIVIGLAHFGESWVYGADTLRPQTVPQFWLRTEDVRFVLNALNKNNPFDQAIDWERTTGIGHSAGGQTMLAMVGAQFSASQINLYCQSDAAKTDKGCAYGQGLVADEAFAKAYGADYCDHRISRVIALDPALGAAATEQSLKRVQANTLIIGAKHNDFLPYNAHSARYAALIPTAKLIGLEGQEGHFVFLNPCDHTYQAQGVALCKDANGVNRVQVHQVIVEHILTFLESTTF